MSVHPILKKAVENDRLASAYLIYGRPPEAFREKLVDFLKGMTCDEAPGFEFCDRCADCRQAENLTHPDVTAVGAPGYEGELGPDDRIGVETVREEILEAASLTPARSNYKLFWLHDLTRFTTEASNTLLKVLEEPPGEAVFLLTSRSRWDCLPTIRSRCQWIRIPREEPSPGSLAERCEYHWAEDFDEETIEDWMALLNGERKSREFNWNRESARRFLEFLLCALDEQYRPTNASADPLMDNLPEDRLSYGLIPDILQRLEELERGGNPTLVVNSLLESIFSPGVTDEWVDAI